MELSNEYLPILRPCLFCSGKTQGRKRRMGSERKREQEGGIKKDREEKEIE